MTAKRQRTGSKPALSAQGQRQETAAGHAEASSPPQSPPPPASRRRRLSTLKSCKGELREAIYALKEGAIETSRGRALVYGLSVLIDAIRGEAEARQAEALEREIVALRTAMEGARHG